MTTVHSYLRFSTKGKQAKGDSSRRQNDYADRICKAQGWALDETLKFADPGMSGFHGKNSTKGDLARFLSLIERKDEAGKLTPGPIKPGNGLVVESLDRISRQTPYESFKIIQKILDADVFIHTGFDKKTYSLASVKADPASLQYLFGVLTRAHEESKAKSERATEAWAQKQANAAGKIITAASKGLPAWIRFNPATGQLELIPERAEIMREMCRLALTMGAHSIAKEFHRRGIPSWQKKGRWDVARITKMLKSRMLIGEYQPTKGRKPIGEPVVNYYPPVLTEGQYYQLQSVIGTRSKVIRGKRGPSVSNLFGALCTSGDDGSVMRVSYKTTENKRYTSVDCMTGANPNFISFPYATFEESFLRHVKELDLSGNTTADRAEIVSLEGQLAAIRAKIDQTQAAGQNATGKAYERILQMLPGLDEQETGLMTRIETAKAKAHRPQLSTADVAAIAAELAKAPEDEKVIGREKLRGAIQTVVESVKLYIRRDGKKRDSAVVCLSTITLRDGLSRFMVVRIRAKMPVFSLVAHRAFKPVDLDAKKMSNMLRKRSHQDDARFASGCIVEFMLAIRGTPKEKADKSLEALTGCSQDDMIQMSQLVADVHGSACH